MSNSTAITEITPRIQLHTVLKKKKKSTKKTVVKDLLCVMNKTKIISNINQCIFSSRYVKFYERQCTKGNSYRISQECCRSAAKKQSCRFFKLYRLYVTFLQASFA